MRFNKSVTSTDSFLENWEINPEQLSSLCLIKTTRKYSMLADNLAIATAIVPVG